MSSAWGGREQLCIAACLALVNPQPRASRKGTAVLIEGSFLKLPPWALSQTFSPWDIQMLLTVLGWEASLQGGGHQCQPLDPCAFPALECLGPSCEFPPIPIRDGYCSASVCLGIREAGSDGQLPSPPEQVLELQTTVCN